MDYSKESPIDQLLSNPAPISAATVGELGPPKNQLETAAATIKAEVKETVTKTENRFKTDPVKTLLVAFVIGGLIYLVVKK